MRSNSGIRPDLTTSQHETFEFGQYPIRLEAGGVEGKAHSHKTIRSLDEFKGLKMRTVGAWSQILPGFRKPQRPPMTSVI